jgi:hypothetical protein
MKRHGRYRMAGGMSLLLVSGWIALPSCSDQDEGDRCEIANGNEDCKEGLLCLPERDVTPPYNTTARCCPQDRSLASHPGCRQATTPFDGGPTPPDTGPLPDVAVDSPEEAEVDATDAADAESDADADDGG